jgi:hypothetical protein
MQPESLIDRLPTLTGHVAAKTVELLGRYPSYKLGLRAAEAVSARVTVTGMKKAVGFAYHAVDGMTYIYEMDHYFGGTLYPSPPHPSIDVWAGLVETWTGIKDATEIQRHLLLEAATNLGSLRALGALEGWICGLTDPDDHRFDEEDKNGYRIGSMINTLRRKRCLLPLAVGERFARASRAGLCAPGVEAIAAHTNREALDLLLQLYKDLCGWDKRGTLWGSIEILAGRLGLTISKVGDVLQVV